MAEYIATRNTCFALISAIEDDFRSLIAASSSSDSLSGTLLPTDVRESALKRRASDLRMDFISQSVPDIDLLAYIDFADIAKVIESKLAPQLDRERAWLKLSAQNLLALTPTRNRVCHTRPLEPDDLARTLDFARSLISSGTPFVFSMVSAAIARLHDEPGFVLTLQIPTFWATGTSRTHNNLPIPEFDETGFLGRSSDRLQVMKLLKSHYPVVTIVGEGGVGKTALALRCLYDLAEDQSSQYDAIVWLSMKTAALTSTGVLELAGAISSTLGLLSELALRLGTPDTKQKSKSELLDEITEYINLYRIVIAIDNLETLSTGSIRELLSRVPAHSKILLTSRVSVGEFEARYPLHGLDEKTAASLLRSYAKLLRIDEISKLDDGNAKGYCKRLFYNPLLIKWFVASVGRGLEPTRLLKSNVKEFGEALSFCFDNLFDRFGSPERTVIDCLVSARKPLSSAEIHYLCPQLNSVEAEMALSALHNSSIVTRSNTAGEGTEYSLSESALKFLSTKSPPDAKVFKDIQTKMRDLRIVLSQEAMRESKYEYDPYFVRTGTSRDEMVCATYLRSALDALHRRDKENARNAVAEAKRLAPSSCEAWRISALIEENFGELFRAVEDYEQSIGLDPKSKISRYCYGMFLMTDMDDLDGALIQLDASVNLDPEAAPILTAKAMALTRLCRFDEAASIHQKLLPELKNRERRWRLTGADQAADCYRRWAHREWELKEFESAKEKLKTALTILFKAAQRADIDVKLLQRVAKVINEALCKKELLDQDFLEFIVVTAEKISETTLGASIPITSEAGWILKHVQTDEIYKQRLLALDRSITNRETMLESTSLTKNSIEKSIAAEMRIGNIHHIVDTGNFGFIIDPSNERWFFHRNFLKSSGDWPLLKNGTPVTYSIGQNSKGLCAIDVSVREEASY